MLLSPKKLLGLALLPVLSGAFLPAQVRTLTDQFGRTLQAEVLALEGETVKIKREDGQLFDLPLANLSDDDQVAIKTWAQDNPPPPPRASTPPAQIKVPVPAAGSVTLNVSRGKFNSDTTYQSAYYKGTNEEWGYNIEVNNTTLHPIDNLRVEYIIFGKLYGGSRQTTQSGRHAVPSLEGKKTDSFRTKAFRFSKFRSSDGSYNYAGGLTGVWARLYAGDVLIAEYASPETLKTKEKWVTPGN